ncbi:MAG: peptidoglycan DD-metalloendopeptidase family protein, partial [Pseudomonadota bacterium]
LILWLMIWVSTILLPVNIGRAQDIADLRTHIEQDLQSHLRLTKDLRLLKSHYYATISQLAVITSERKGLRVVFAPRHDRIAQNLQILANAQAHMIAMWGQQLFALEKLLDTHNRKVKAIKKRLGADAQAEPEWVHESNQIQALVDQVLGRDADDTTGDAHSQDTRPQLDQGNTPQTGTPQDKAITLQDEAIAWAPDVPDLVNTPKIAAITPAFDPPVLHTGFPGKTTSPASGTVIHRFGARTPFGQINKGLSLATQANSPILAPFAGEVIFSRILDNLGQVIILRHGDDYHSVLTGIDYVLVKEAENVASGDVLGYMPKRDSEFYLELRKEGTPIDPERYISIRKNTQG